MMLTYVMSCDSDADICDAKHIVLICLSRASHVTVMLTYVMLTYVMLNILCICDADIVMLTYVMLTYVMLTYCAVQG